MIHNLTAGGTSLIGGLRERLEKEMSEQVPPAVKVKVVTPANTLERRYSVWIGGQMRKGSADHERAGPGGGAAGRFVNKEGGPVGTAGGGREAPLNPTHERSCPVGLWIVMRTHKGDNENTEDCGSRLGRTTWRVC